MNRLVLLLPVFASTGAWAASPIDETIPASGAEQLSVVNVSGVVTVTGTNDDQVQVSGELSDDAEELEVRRDGDRIIVHVNMPQNRNRGRIEDTTLTIRAPRDLSVIVNTVSASITVDEMEGEQDLNSVSGSIDTEQYAEEIQAKTVSGRIRVNGLNDPSRTQVSSVSGRVELDTVAGELNAQTISGRIDLDSDRLERSELKSVSGSISVDAALTDDARLSAVTTSGRIELNLRGDAVGQYDLSTFSGSIDNCFGPRPTRSRFGPPNESIRFDEGDGDARIEASSMSGSIDLCRN
jgi:DUF4097 and DUF4098 domain-containing protein YvlB